MTLHQPAPLAARRGAADSPPRVAIAHDWLVRYAGSERCVNELLVAFPGAEVLTTLVDPSAVPAPLRGARPSVLQRIPGATSHHEWLLPLMPLAWRVMAPPTGVDAVVSSSHACAKAVPVEAGTPHLCYCHTPMRYAWDFEAERERFPRGSRTAARGLMAWFRRWDRATASRVTRFVANSRAVAGRIERFYGRRAQVVPPPVRTDFFTPGGERGDGFLYVGRLTGYKRPDLVVEAFRDLPYRLTVVGKGAMAAGAARARDARTCSSSRSVTDEELRELYRSARAMVYPVDEDFGIVMAEAQACGTPVISIDAGGALDIVEHGVTGWLMRGRGVARPAGRRAPRRARAAGPAARSAPAPSASRPRPTARRCAPRWARWSRTRARSDEADRPRARRPPPEPAPAAVRAPPGSSRPATRSGRCSARCSRWPPRARPTRCCSSATPPTPATPTRAGAAMLHAWRRDWGGLWDRLYAVAGNHDLDSPRGLELWREIVPARRPAPPYCEGLGFELRLGPVLVLGLDTTSGLVNALQRDWAAASLAGTSAAHRIAVYHEPAFPLGLHRGHALDALPDERDRLWTTLEAGGVSVVLNGHEHAYARSEIRRSTAIQQVITGGAGGDLYGTPCPDYDVFLPEHHLVVLDADDRRLVLRALDLSGRVIDEIEIEAKSATEVAT